MLYLLRTQSIPATYVYFKQTVQTQSRSLSHSIEKYTLKEPSWRLSNVTFWPKPNMRNKVFLKLVCSIFLLKILERDWNYNKIKVLKFEKSWDKLLGKNSLYRQSGKRLTHFMPLISFDTPWKHQKTRGFRMFSGGIKSDQWNERG